MSASLERRSIDKLLKERFVIPSYQRGYRWTERQVRDLLQDLHEFQRQARTLEEGAFYCLQPVVVRPMADGRWELIDGQQRLTTLYLILSVLQPILTLLKRTPYEVSYATREHSAEFLAAPSMEQAHDNIDFFHIARAHQTIEDWFEEHDAEGTVRFDFARFLLASEAPNAQIIWYELPAEDDPIDVFVRLNVGRIPLTNAELIRALFLRKNNYTQTGLIEQVAHQWDLLEKQLRDDRFWYFLNGAAPDLPTRIEFLFSVYVRTLGASIAHGDPYGVFVAFTQIPEAAWFDRWREVKQLAMRLEEWFEDRALFHLVGTWLHVQTRGTKPAQRPSDAVAGLLEARLKMSRPEFERHLRQLLALHLLGKPVSDPELQAETLLSDLTYGTHDARLRDLLLLFNVASLLENEGSNLRFPFELFQREHWDLEHIRSVTEYRPHRVDDQKRWLALVVAHWADQPPTERQAVAARAASALLDDFKPKQFDAVYELVQQAFDEGDAPDTSNSAANLTLLDASTNRSYGNAPFPVKRRKIIELDKTGTFVPLCTTNAFLKYYSAYNASSMSWSAEDAEHYGAAIQSTLTRFFRRAQ